MINSSISASAAISGIILSDFSLNHPSLLLSRKETNEIER